eukprot:scaffold295468_cov27-Tisochrysis_lutea.AAC.2
MLSTARHIPERLKNWLALHQEGLLPYARHLHEAKSLKLPHHETTAGRVYGSRVPTRCQGFAAKTGDLGMLTNRTCGDSKCPKPLQPGAAVEVLQRRSRGEQNHLRRRTNALLLLPWDAWVPAHRASQLDRRPLDPVGRAQTLRISAGGLGPPQGDCGLTSLLVYVLYQLAEVHPRIRLRRHRRWPG